MNESFTSFSSLMDADIYNLEFHTTKCQKWGILEKVFGRCTATTAIGALRCSVPSAVPKSRGSCLVVRAAEKLYVNVSDSVQTRMGPNVNTVEGNPWCVQPQNEQKKPQQPVLESTRCFL